MSPWFAKLPGGRSGRVGGRSQHGFTLIEVLLVVAISGLIIGPLFAWMILTMRQQPVQRDGMLVSAQAGLLRGQFPRDVTVAGAARVYPVADEPGTEWATWREACRASSASGGRHLAVLIAQGETRTKTIYSVAPMRDGNTVVSGRSSIWRTECAANTGLLTHQSQVVEDIDPTPAATFASCMPAAPTTGTEVCRQIALQVTQRDAEGAARVPVSLSATRRTDLASLSATTTGNFLPVARIAVVSQTWNGAGSPSTTVVLSGSESRDPDGAADGADLSYLWELPEGPEGSGAGYREVAGVNTSVTLPAAGEYWVRLTVMDSDGAVNFSYRRFSIENRAPIAVADVSPLTVTAGTDTIAMSGINSSDPDSPALAAYRWRVSSALDAGAGLETVFMTPTASFAVPDWVIGNLVVELTVTDSLGATATEVRDVTVIDPTAPETTTTTLPGETTTTEPGATTTTTTTTTVPVTPAPPSNVRVDGNILYWDARPGARRYVIDLEAVNNGCARELQVIVSAATTQRTLPPNPCSGTGTSVRARVGADFGGEAPWYSDWVSVPVVVK